jgi:WD40 repeat protein
MISLENINILWLVFESFPLPKVKAISSEIANSTLLKVMYKIMSFEKRLEKLGKNKSLLIGHKNKVNSLAILQDGNIISASDDKTLKVWDIKTLQCIFTIEDDSMINSVIVLNDGTIVYCTYSIKVQETKDDYNSFKTIDLEDYRALNNLVLLSNDNLAISASNKFGLGSVVLTLDPSDDYKCIKSLSFLYKVDCIINLLSNIFISSANMIHVYNIDEDYKEIERLGEHWGYVYSLAYVEKANLLISGSNNKNIRIWNMDDYKCIKTINCDAAVKCLLALPNGYFLSAYYDNTVKVWTTNDFECIHTFNLHKQVITSMIMVDDNKVVSASFEKNIIVLKF